MLGVVHYTLPVGLRLTGWSFFLFSLRGIQYLETTTKSDLQDRLGQLYNLAAERGKFREYRTHIRTPPQTKETDPWLYFTGAGSVPMSVQGNE